MILHTYLILISRLRSSEISFLHLYLLVQTYITYQVQFFLRQTFILLSQTQSQSYTFILNELSYEFVCAKCGMILAMNDRFYNLEYNSTS